MKLRHYDAFGTVDDKRAVRCHIWNRAKENVLNHGSEIFMIRVCTIKLQLGFQGYAICKSALETFVYAVTWRVDIVIQELKNEIVSCVGDREVFCKHLIQTVILAFLRWCVQLQEVFERL